VVSPWVNQKIRFQSERIQRAKFLISSGLAMLFKLALGKSLESFGNALPQVKFCEPAQTLDARSGS